MAPGAEPKIAADDLKAAHMEDSDFSISKEEVAKLEPRIQKLVNEYHNLPVFERTFGFRAPIVWFNVVGFIFLHAVALLAGYFGPKATWHSWFFFLFMYLFSGLGVTAGVHRYWAHKTYKAILPMQIILMCFNCISMQNDIIEWCRDHRVHHKYSETSADPHNAKRGFFFAHMGWLMMKKHPDVFIKGRNVDISDLQRDPVIRFQHRYYLPLCFFFTVFLPTFIPCFFWGEQFWVAFTVLFAFRYVMTLHSTWLVNSAAHLWGSRNYDKNCNPSDNRFVSFAAIGEGWHNYHHTFPYDYATSEWGPRINMTTIFIDFMASLGLVYDRKQVSQEAIDRVRRRKGDLSTS